MQYAGLRRRARPGGGHHAPGRARHHGVPRLRQHRAPVDHRLGHAAPAAKRLYTDGARRCAGRGDPARRPTARSVSRGPDLCLGYTDPALTAAGSTPTAGTAPATSASARRRRLPHHHRPQVGHDHPRRREHQRAWRSRSSCSRMPGVAEAAVVAAPDARLGEHAAAVLRMLPGATVPTLDQVRAHLDAAGLARQKWPEELHVVTSLGATTSPGPPAARSRSSCSGERLRLPKIENSILVSSKGGFHAIARAAVSAVRRGQPPVRDAGGVHQVPAEAVRGRHPVRAAQRPYEDRHPRPDQRVHPEPDLRGRGPARRDGGVLHRSATPRASPAGRSSASRCASIPAFREPGPRLELMDEHGHRALADVPDARAACSRSACGTTRSSSTWSCTRSTSGCTRPGRSTTRTASSPSR